MKIRNFKILPMLSAPESSASPVAALYFALLAAACLTAAVATLLGSI